MRDLYQWTLRGVLRHSFLTMLVAAGTVVATVFLYELLPKGFIPNQDTDQLGGTTEMPQEASFESMVRLQQKAAAVVGADPNVEAYFSLVNAQGGGQSSGNAGRLQLRLKPRAQRKLTPEQIIEELRPKLNQIPGIRTYLQNPPLIRVGGQQTRTVYQYTLQAQDLDELYHAAGTFEKRMKDIPGLFDVNSDLQIASPEVVVDIDRDHASSLDVTADQIEDALYDAFGERQVSDIYTPTNDYWVIMELQPALPVGSRGIAPALHPFRHRKIGPARRRHQTAQYRRPALGHTPWPVALGHVVVQPRAWSFSRRRGRSHWSRRARSTAGRHQHLVSGRSRGVSVVAARAWDSFL